MTTQEQIDLLTQLNILLELNTTHKINRGVNILNKETLVQLESSISKLISNI